ncbi:hypothetical protein MGG_16079 [Pyricularia oryzae 70-15]|uniref:Uncharacterized protein n=2 Tax=Pyricularia oryzae TaxID=318829 RepID=G4MQ27_PYRO7|nr:uncharacterized protein MGG_16079 [Pyricularia oryzae 70-15]EHA56420.1 hypothetical protein MGG_16079 [Pyricularia oryzae 70-15]ELQ36890.1 hypothetical protein OOU_Y34scaffold00626g6 [Pyricularia oryzae Y34]
MHPSSRSQEDPFYGFESINSIHLLEICNSLGALCPNIGSGYALANLTCFIQIMKLSSVFRS